MHEQTEFRVLICGGLFFTPRNDELTGYVYLEGLANHVLVAVAENTENVRGMMNN